MKRLWIIVFLLFDVNLYAGDMKTTELAADASPDSENLLMLVDDPSGSATNVKTTVGQLFNRWITVNGLTSNNDMRVDVSSTTALVVEDDGVNDDVFVVDTVRSIVLVTGELDIVHTASAPDEHALDIEVNAAGVGDIKAIEIDYITGAISAGEDEGIILLNIDEIDATGGEVFGLEVLATEGSAGIYGLKVGAVVSPIHQDSGVFANPTTATDNTTSTNVPNMIDGNDANTTAIFESDNEYILVGAASAFEEIEFILTTDANVNITPTFGYSISGAHTFTTFTPVDGTNGFKNTGVVAWDASDLTNHTTNDNTNSYDILITRTRNNVSTTPVLGYAKIAATTEYVWDKNGAVNVLSMETSQSGSFGGALTPSRLTADPCGAYAEGSIFYNSTSNYMCYCDGTNDVKMHDPTAACF